MLNETALTCLVKWIVRQIPMEHAPALRPKCAEQWQPESLRGPSKVTAPPKNGRSLNAYV